MSILCISSGKPKANLNFQVQRPDLKVRAFPERMSIFLRAAGDGS